MGRHTGERTRTTTTAPRPSRRRLLVLSTLVTVTLVAWGVLVVAAIDFGREARSGNPSAWTFLALASLGAAACLFVTMILGARLVALVREPLPAAVAPAATPPAVASAPPAAPPPAPPPARRAPARPATSGKTSSGQATARPRSRPARVEGRRRATR